MALKQQRGYVFAEHPAESEALKAVREYVEKNERQWNAMFQYEWERGDSRRRGINNAFFMTEIYKR